MRFAPLLLLALACATPPAPVPAAPTPPSTLTSLEGVVRSASGQPVEGAVVALIPTDPAWLPTAPPAGRMRSEAGGRFRFEGIAAGEYGLSATAPGQAAVFKVGVKLGAGEAVRDMELRLGARGGTLRGTVRVEGGAPSPEVWIGVVRVSDTYGDLAYVQANAEGAYEVTLTAGQQYGLVAVREGFLPGLRDVAVEQALTTPGLDLSLQRAPLKTPPSPEVVSWLKQSAVPLATVEPGHGFADLQPLKSTLAGARVVALGEATHGTREFFQLKHRMFEFLATELGFTVFAIEANFGEALAINDYVLTGKGDPAQALAGLYFWTWDTEEVLALIRWMRAYNADPQHPRKLKFYGVDMQFSPGSTRALLDYFARVDPAYRKQVEGRLQPLLDWRYGKAPRPGEEPPVALARELEARLQAGHEAYARKSSEKAWALAARHARVLSQFAEMKANPARDVDVRDRAMAENARWILEHEGPGTKAVVWAHNGHVALSDPGLLPPMGQHLREALGEALYSFGFAFNQGSFRAIYLPAGPHDAPRGLITHTVPPAPEGSLDAALARTGLPRLALDLRAVPREGPVTDFFTQPRETRSYGAVYREGMPPRYTRAALQYDGLLFIEHTQAAVATSTGRRPPATK